LLAATVLPLLGGCEDFDAAMMTLSDEMSFADGYYYPDEHHSSEIEGDCPSSWDYGRLDNQAYARATNLGDTDATVTIQWSAGSASTLYLQPGETSDFEYRSGSIIPRSVEISC
jgi:hypothetical protein